MEAKNIILRLIDRYNACQSNQYQIVRWPDEENRQSRDIDAYAESASGQSLAIEHTNVETFFGQLQDAARFGDYYGQLESELKHAFGFSLTLILPIFAFQRGTKWGHIRDLIREWLLSTATTLPDGYSSHQINDVPFSIGVSKNVHNGFFNVARRAPSDQDIQLELVQNFAERLADKNDQLSKYRTAGTRTLLLLESSDIALVSHVSLYKAFLQAHQNIPMPNIDEFWLACTYDPESYCDLCCLLGPEEIMDCVNPEGFRFGPRYLLEWSQAIKEDLAKLGSIDLRQYIPMAKR